jgi:hypothetical protein
VVAKQFIFYLSNGQGTRNKLQEYGIREGQRKSSTMKTPIKDFEQPFHAYWQIHGIQVAVNVVLISF